MITLENIIPSKYTDKKVHCGITGSISSYKVYEYIRLLQKSGIQVSATLSEHAHEFISSRTLEALHVFPLYTNNEKYEEPFAHLYPVQNVDAFVIAPATANSIGKIASGIADTLLATQAIAYNKRLLFAPAMNTNMWDNSIVQKNIAFLQECGHVVCPVQYGALACGEEGNGKIIEPFELYLYTLKVMTPQVLLGKNILFTIGGTQEPFDSVRYVSNYSSGLMGLCLALTAWLQGANVHIVGVEEMPFLPHDIVYCKAPTAKEMYEQCLLLWEDMDIGFFVAAVSDFIPNKHNGKYKKEGVETLFIECTSSKDIVYEIGKIKNNKQKIIAFCAETENLLESMRKKISKKNADYIIGNYTKDALGTVSNTVQILDKNGKNILTEDMRKIDLAFFIMEYIFSTEDRDN